MEAPISEKDRHAQLYRWTAHNDAIESFMQDISSQIQDEEYQRGYEAGLEAGRQAAYEEVRKAAQERLDEEYKELMEK